MQSIARLESLASRALEASQPPCDPAVAEKLLRLAEYACQSLRPAPALLETRIKESLAALKNPAHPSMALDPGTLSRGVNPDAATAALQVHHTIQQASCGPTIQAKSLKKES